MSVKGYAVFTAFWVRDDLREGGSKAFLSLELASDACMVLVALGFWLPSVRSLLGNTASIAFVAGLAWLILAGVRDLRESLPDPELPFHLNVATAISALALYGIVCGPLIYWGFQYAVLGGAAGS
jgi:hypothetical protein